MLADEPRVGGLVLLVPFAELGCTTTSVVILRNHIVSGPFGAFSCRHKQNQKFAMSLASKAVESDKLL